MLIRIELISYTPFLQIKQSSMTLVKMYMKRLTMELKSIQNSDRESSQDSLLLQGVHFAYRAHQVFFLVTFKACKRNL